MKNLSRSGSIKVSCKQCGQKFKSPPSRIKWGHSVFCSRICSSEWKKKAYKGRKGIQRFGEDNPRWKGRSAPKPCYICGKIFRGIGKTCSVEHGHQLQAIKISGQGNPNWQGIEVNLRKNYRSLIKDKLGNCFKCGSKKQIHAHHKDFDHSHNYPDNLINVCNSCHQKIHWDEKRRVKEINKNERP